MKEPMDFESKVYEALKGVDYTDFTYIPLEAIDQRIAELKGGEFETFKPQDGGL